MSRTWLHAMLARLTAPPGASAPVPDRPAAAERLAARIAARAWRRSGVDAETAADIRAKAAAAIAAGVPLGFAVPFGGYKGPRQPAAPHIDWAELFWIAHLRAYAETLAALHAPGVVISLSYFHGVLGGINRLPQSDQDRYIQGLRALLAHYSDARIRFELIDLSALFGGPAGAVAAIERRYDELRRSGAEPPGPALRSAARNVMHDHASEAVIREAALRCLAMESLEERRRFNKFGPRIQITHIRGASLSLHLGSCATSIHQPWVGTGVLEGDGAGGWRPRIVNGGAIQPGAWVEVAHKLQGLSPALGRIGLLQEGASD
ncbi:hypothetical protein [Ancylobacter sp. IITR112]|uniref:hypothetical protein n=1 Tax=Ancylobacter sp. IITR112 TaxID=3138073 RepID=UPI00352B50B7